MRAPTTLFVLIVGVASLRAQAANPTPTTADSTAQVQPPAAPGAASPDTYTYDPDSRRDPFVNLLGTGSEPRATSRKGEGAAGMAVADISVRGVMQSRGALVAMVQGPDNRTYLVHSGDKLLDGTIKSVTPQGLIIMQDVNDPLSAVKQHEVRKLLRGLEDTK